LRMWASTLALVSTVSAQQLCIVSAGDLHFDFTQYAKKQVVLETSQWNFTFTFCDSNPCGAEDSSLCLSNDSGDTENLGVWANDTKWSAQDGKVSGHIYGSSIWCDQPRDTLLTFQCSPDGLKFMDMTETAKCHYEALIQVPMLVCEASACCTTPTYSSTRLDLDGTTTVVQFDAKSGNWYDGNYQGKGQGLLCSTDYQRCFTFTSTTCVSDVYRPPPPAQCFGVTSDFNFVKAAPLSVDYSLRQSAWFSRTEGYLVTMPLGAAGQCVVVSGSKVETSFDFGLSPNTSYWAAPRSCIKNGFVV